jgi:hypothetical protein
MKALRFLGLVPIVLLASCSSGGTISDPASSGGPTDQDPSGTGTGNTTPGGTGTGNTTTTPGNNTGSVQKSADIKSLTAAQTEVYLSKLAPAVVGRVLSATERATIATGGAAIEGILAAWVKEPGFAAMARQFIEQSLSVSGQKNDVDFGTPGNLAVYLVQNNRPWSEILTSTVCYDGALKPVACDSGAPFTAGVLTTRAFLISRASRFNLTRSSAVMKNFACRAYPIEDTLQPRIDKSRLIPMFAATNLMQAAAADNRAASGFGNGEGCYTCHGQFSLHAQLYVKFNTSGLWQAAADGIQDPMGELGRSLNGLMASHLQNPAEAKSEASSMFGTPVNNLAEAAKVVATSPTFDECAAHRFLDFTLGLPYGTIEYDTHLFPSIAESARALSPDPTFSQIVQSLYTNPVVVHSIISSLTGE